MIVKKENSDYGILNQSMLQIICERSFTLEKVVTIHRKF